MKPTEEIEKERLEQEIQSFYENICQYGYLDIKRAVEIFLEVGLTGEKLAEQVLEFAEDTSTPINKIDVCYIAYDYILQQARNKINEVLKFDFCNDIKKGDIYTYGNYMCSSYDYSDEAIKQLQEVINKATEEQKAELKEDKITMWFLNEIDVKL